MSSILLPSPARHRDDVRSQIDQKVGTASGMRVVDVYTQLTNPEKVEWLLGELLVSFLDHRLHIWHQHFCPKESSTDETAWLELYHGLAGMARSVNPEIAELFSWTLQNVERGVALSSVIPYVWSYNWEPVARWSRELVERWPEDLEPCELSSEWRHERELISPDPDHPRFPNCNVAFTSHAQSCAYSVKELTREHIVEACSYGLWKSGASDALLDEFYFSLSGSPADFVLNIQGWVDIDGHGSHPERISEIIKALSPLETLLGVESLQQPLVRVINPDRKQEFETALASFYTSTITAASEHTINQQLRSALRMDPEIIYFTADEIQDENDWELFLQAALTGHILVVVGENEDSNRWSEKLEAVGIVVRKDHLS